MDTAADVSYEDRQGEMVQTFMNPHIHTHIERRSRVMQETDIGCGRRILLVSLIFLALIVGNLIQSSAEAFTLNVVGCDEANNCNVHVGTYRWLLEEDNTNQSPPGVRVHDSIGVDIHKSHAPVVSKGTSDDPIVIPDPNKQYFLSVMPDAGFSIGGAAVAAGAQEVTVKVHQYPIPTAQISVLVFEDHNTINNVFDAGERGLGGFTITIADAGGPVSQDVFGNPIGAEYDEGGNYIPGTGGVITTCTQDDVDNQRKNCTMVGEAFIKNLAPGKYGVIATPPIDQPGWVQTATIEGTITVDAWVKAKEPPKFFEGFGTGFHHVFIGFVDPAGLPWANGGPGTGSITGRNVYNHFSRPPTLQGFYPGAPVGECWIGLNDLATQTGLVAVPCDGNSNFTITGIPDGTYQLVTWDKPLIALFGFNTVTIPDANGNRNIDLGNVLSFRWFGTFKGSVFYDTDQDGFRDCVTAACDNRLLGDETGIMNQNINIRFRDGSIYQAQPTDAMGEYEFSTVFPFFKWLVAEVDFARYKATGMTAVVDYGGQILPHNGWTMPSFDVLNPQPQAAVNPNTGNNLSRTETGQVLTQGLMLFLNQTNYADWGKAAYAAGENGGISGVVFYATTRAENDPRYAVGDPWEPGIPRVQVNLYKDANRDGIIDDINGIPGIQLADVDNYPLGWADGTAPKGPEDVVNCGDGTTFCQGDAVDVTHTDSWDDNQPTGCIQTLPVLNGQTVKECFDNFGTWNQMRPAVFDGGYAFGPNLPPGTYIVEAAAPVGYEHQREESKNVDFGDTYAPSPLLLPPLCVGDPHVVPAELQLFPGVATFYAGQTRPLCNRKQVTVSGGKNTAADFHMYTEVPKAARLVGFVNNDLAAEFDPNSPIFGEKSAPAWIPISIQDWQGNEVARVYTDEFGSYNALLPSTFTANIPTPSGISPNMLTVVLNHPIRPDGSRDPYYDSNYATAPWTFNFMPATTSYLDTPIVPVGAFVGFPKSGADVEPPDGTPIITVVNGSQGGPLACADGDVITIASAGYQEVPNPDYDPNVAGSTSTIIRDYGFGNTQGTVKVGDQPLTITNWTNATITATVNTSVVTTGQLTVIRGDNNKSTPVGLTFHVLGSADCANVVHVQPNSVGTPLQDAIDNAAEGALIIAAPGTYHENVIMYKNVKLQGSGADTNIFANPNPADRLTAWHNKIQSILGADPFRANEAPGIMVIGNAPATSFPMNAAPLIDGFTIFGAIQGGGIYVSTDAYNLVISNNVVMSNQGSNGGGITLGMPEAGNSNPNIVIRNNYIAKNGGVFGGGGITVYEGADNYLITKNIITGNLSRWNGGGIAHSGLSDGGVISDNKIFFNEVFFGLAVGGDAGGIYVAGAIANGDGAGNVTISGNLIQGNLSGSGSGGGIRALWVNAPGDALNYELNIFNNMIVNNVAGYAGGGIALQDAEVVSIINNTIAHNDSTATARNAFMPGALDSTPQGAGIVASAHSAGLAAASGNTFSNPTLVNNIIWMNRSFYNNHTLNGGAGGLAPNPTTPYWDLQVAGVAEAMNPDYCLLTRLSYGDGNNYNDGTNKSANPMFVAEYSNALVSSTVLDEGGNNITVRFTPLKVTAGDYHIRTNSAAVNAGTNAYLTLFEELQSDYDNEVRPNALVSDIGADEMYAATVPPIPVPLADKVGTFRSGRWYLDYNGNTKWDPPYDVTFTFGMSGDVAVSGDWNGAGTTEIGVFRAGKWYLDINGNGAWDAGIDLVYTFGLSTDIPVIGDWNGSGASKIGTFRAGKWYLDNGNGVWNAGIDIVYSFGMAGDKPVTGDWDGDGKTEIGVFRNGTWYLDSNGNGVWNAGTDAVRTFGLATDIPITGDWNGDGTTDIGVFRNGTWYLDSNGNGILDPCGTDGCFTFGLASDKPVTGKW
ncbi:MAG: hypothetical protein ACOYW7_13480 [Nitrospirota bacterium]